jgi:hypothetical protein
MARQIGPPFIVGKLGGLQFYEMNGNYYVRVIPSTSKRTNIKKQSERSRENHQEFHELRTVGKDIRQNLGYYWNMLKNPQRNGKLIKHLKFVKNADQQSARGQRKVSIGIQSEEGKGFLRGIDLNHVSPLQSILSSSTQIEVSISGIHLNEILPQRDIHFPSGAEGIRITGLLLNATMEERHYELIESNHVDIHPDQALTELLLNFPSRKVHGTAAIIFLSFIFFHNDQNGTAIYDQRPENVLTILDVF